MVQSRSPHPCSTKCSHSSASPPSNNPSTSVADAYYATHKIVAGLLKQNNHLLTRMKSNAVAYTAYQQRGPRKRGRPRVYGRKIKLSSLWQASSDFQPAPSPVYGENKVIIQYRVRDLLWRPAGRLRALRRRDPSRERCLPPHAHRHFP